MLVALIGNMMAPSFAFGILAQFLTIRGIPVISLLGGGKETNYIIPLTIQRMITHASVVLVGLSAPEKLAQKELEAAAMAKIYKIPFGFYADTHDVFMYPWLAYGEKYAHLRNDASFCFVLNDEEKPEAQKVFQNAEIVASGNPTWEDFFSSRLSRDEVRSRLNILPDEKAVLCSIGTGLESNLAMLKALNEALNSGQNQNTPWKIIVGIHPGDQNWRNKPDIYKESIGDRAPTRFIAREELPTMEIIPGADYVVDCVGSSVGINAACQRKPMICYCSEESLTDLEKSISKRSWKPFELGIMLLVYNPNQLADAFNHDFTEMIEQQKKIYPAPIEKGRAVRIMAETLQKYGSSGFKQK